MCLYSDSNKAKKADRPIVCYKSVQSFGNAGKTDEVMFYSAFQGFQYRPGQVYFEPEFDKANCTRMISKGFHSHADVKKAMDEASWGASGFPADTVLRCEIPAGALYYHGGNGYDGDYCSDFIVITGWKKFSENEWHVPYITEWNEARSKSVWPWMYRLKYILNRKK